MKKRKKREEDEGFVEQKFPLLFYLDSTWLEII